jgi:hypothetical protein
MVVHSSNEELNESNWQREVFKKAFQNWNDRLTFEFINEIGYAGCCYQD